MKSPRVRAYESCSYAGGLFHSRLEARYAARLDLLRKAKDRHLRVVDVKRQVKMDLSVNGKHIAFWYVDFEVTFGDGRVELHEVKGFDTEVYRLKKKLFDALYPNRTLVMFRDQRRRDVR
jgi:hypothetical protein